MRPRSATACGLRATALRCSAPRASSRGRRRSRSSADGCLTAPTRSPRPRCAGRPWPPALLAAPEIARRQSPPPRSTTSPHLVEKTLKCARAGERERQARVAVARAPFGTCARRRATQGDPVGIPWPVDSLAFASALFSPSAGQARNVAERGGWGFLLRDFGSGEERRCPGSPSEARPRRASRRCALGRQHRPATPATSRRSPGRRAPQRSRAKAAGRSRPRTHERSRNPHPLRDARSSSASRSLRASPPGEAPAPQARGTGVTRCRHAQPTGVRLLVFRS